MKLYVLLAIFAIVASQKEHHCPQQNATYTTLEWDWMPATLSLQVNGLYHELHCCAQHYSHISWWERNDAISPWKPFQNSDRRNIDTDVNHLNETVIFKSVRFSDAHDYMCQVVDQRSSRRLQNIVELQVFNTSVRNGPSLLIEPKELNQTIHVQLGKPLEFSCIAFFAVEYQCEFCNIFWQRRSNATSFTAIKTNSSENVYHKKGNSVLQEGALESIVHIRNATLQDLGLYTCEPFNGWFAGSPIAFFELIKAEAPPSNWMRPSKVVILTLTIALATIVVIVGILFVNRLRIRIKVEQFKKWMKPKTSYHESLLASSATTAHEGDDLEYPKLTDSQGNDIPRGAPWVGVKNQGHQWIEVNFGRAVVVNSIVTQGCSHINDSITECRVKFSEDNVTWWEFKDSQQATEASNCILFKVNGNTTKREVHELPAGILTQYVRVYPTEWAHTTPALRLDLLGWRGTHDVTLIYPELLNHDYPDFCFGLNLEKNLHQTHSVFSPRVVDLGIDENDSVMDSIKSSRLLVVLISKQMLKDAFSEAEQLNGITTVSGALSRAGQNVSETHIPLLESGISEGNNEENGLAVDRVALNVEIESHNEIFLSSLEDRIRLKRYLIFINSCQGLAETIFVIHNGRIQWNDIRAGCKKVKCKKEYVRILDKLQIAVESSRMVSSHEFVDAELVNTLECIFQNKVLKPSPDAEEAVDMLLRSTP